MECRVLVVCMVGIPGAGKSTVARSLCSSSSSSVRLVVFDDFCSRVAALSVVEAALRENSSSSPSSSSSSSSSFSALVVDDNSYYRSMRRDVFRLARDAGARYVALLLDTPLHECLSRNAARQGKERIEEHLVVRMHQRLERPSDRGWDRCVVYQGDITWQTLMEHSILPHQKEDEEEEQTKKQTSSAEMLDLQLRREISEKVAAADPKDRAALAAKLNKERKEKLKTK